MNSQEEQSLKEKRYPKGNKTVQDSTTKMTKCLQYKDINGDNRLFGGRLMEWIDEVAGIVAVRHCECSITTAAVDQLIFKAGAFLNDIIILIAHPTYVGRTSMEVRVDTYVEDIKTGQRHMINHAYLTEVCVDENGRPKPIPYGLELQNETERIEWEGALKRQQVRKERKAQGY